MRKNKIIPIIVTITLLTVFTSSLSGAEQLEGDIQAEISEYVGLVKPELNLTENQTINLKVDGDPGNYTVNDTISIKVTKEGEMDRLLPPLVPRSVLVSILGTRSLKDVIGNKDLKRRFLTKLFPIK